MEVQNHLYNQEWYVKDYKIVQCQTCGFKHIYPTPSTLELERFYWGKYYKEIKPFPYAQVTEEYIGKRIEQVNRNYSYNEIFNRVEKLKLTNIQRMVDIGCGNNLLVRFFQDRDWEVFALEPSHDAANFLKLFDLQVFDCSVEEIESTNITEISFINLQFVLEHIVEPFTVLKKLYEIMVPGGVIRVAVPNDFSEGQLAYVESYKEDFHWVCFPDHINYFTFDSLHNLLEKIGFQEVYRTTNFPLEFLLASGLNYYASEEERKKVGPIVKDFESSFRNTGRGELLKKYYESLAQLGFGRSIYIYAIKR